MPILFPVTYQCNLDCVYCNEKGKELVDIEKGTELISKSKEEWVYITGGEPLLVPNIELVCDRLRKAGKKVGLTTNGTIHNFNIFSHVDRVGISLDGDEETTDKNRGIGTYKKAVIFLTEAVKHHIETVIMATVIERDMVQEKYLEDLGDKFGVTYFQETVCRK